MGYTVRVMHFADTHFGVEQYGKLDAATGLNSRLLDFKTSLMRAINRAIEEDVDIAIFAGDAYKARDPRQTEQREFAECIRRLSDKDIPVVLLTGNHDLPVMKGRANAIEIYRTLGVEKVYVYSRPEVECIPTKRGTLRVAAMPYLAKGVLIGREELKHFSLDETRRYVEERYCFYIEELAKKVREAEDDIPTVLMGHFWVSGAKLSSWQQGYLGNSNEPQVPLSVLTNPAFDYVALGHIHRFQDLHPQGQPHVVYCGSPDRIDFGEREEEKGFVIADVYKGGADYRFIEVDVARKMVEIEVDADCDDPTAAILSAIRRHPIRDNIVRLIYHIEAERDSLVDQRLIEEALSPALVRIVRRAIRRNINTRNSALTENRQPREALTLYIETQDKLRPLKDRLLEAAEPLFQALEQEEREFTTSL